MPGAEIGDHRPPRCPGVVPHDLARLRGAVDPVRFRRCGVDLDPAVTVEISQLDFMHERVGLPVQLRRGPAAAVIGHQHGHDALVVRGDREAGENKL